MHDATMSIDTQDEILVHRRLLLPLFLLLSVFSVFPDSQPVPFIPLGEARQRMDNRIAVNRDFYFSSDSYVLTDVQGDSWPLRACLHGGGGPQVGEITCLGGIPRLSI